MNSFIKKSFTILMLAVTFAMAPTFAKDLAVSKTELMNKIKGGWAGQTIGVVFGAPYEFKFTGSYVQDYQPVPWSRHYILYWWNKKPGLFDDIYNDCTFVETFSELGIDCDQKELAESFAFADYHLAHANQMGRYNIRHGIMPPASGNWINNPHADDIDFQIESDFIGLMTPAMPTEALKVADKVGHIMNSGDGFYGGAFVSAMYSAAFYLHSPENIIKTALSVIPKESKFYQCINDVIVYHEKHPDNWKECWFMLQDKWNHDVGCPKGVFLSFNIDAKFNSALVAMAMLYGNGDYTETLDIAARAGQDSDCNPSTCGGILGVMYGYDKIPSFWLDPLKEIEDSTFQGTDMSLSKSYQMSFDLATKFIKLIGGKVSKTSVEIPIKDPSVLPLEQNFTDTYPLFRGRKDCFVDKDYSFDFDGNGFVIWGNLCCLRHINKDYIARVSMRHIGSEVFSMAEPDDDYIAKVEVWIDGRLDVVADMPMRGQNRRLEPAWKYQLAEGHHIVELHWLNPQPEYTIRINDIQYYSQSPQHSRFYSNLK
ncbi:hypothetical protein PRBRB14_15300 [Hallella multisaccharivorax DSM 17128]|nr:ADP-ribosylglycohydrolase family protein [Hallella multisaccharivorax]GJG30651.1 hypothetical protein PRBRB14_15300 [Hallella multisaccharivorax DSM 17128]